MSYLSHLKYEVQQEYVKYLDTVRLPPVFRSTEGHSYEYVTEWAQESQYLSETASDWKLLRFVEEEAIFPKSPEWLRIAVLAAIRNMAINTICNSSSLAISLSIVFSEARKKTLKYDLSCLSPFELQLTLAIFASVVASEIGVNGVEKNVPISDYFIEALRDLCTILQPAGN